MTDQAPAEIPSFQRRALFFGVQAYLDEALPPRPGTSAALRHIAELFELDGWDVRLLIDDAAEERARPLAANLLAQLDWLKAGDERLALISCARSGAYLLPRDARAHLLEQTALEVEALSDQLKRAGLILDLPCEESEFSMSDWALGAPMEEVVEPPSYQGPTRFLKRTLRGLSGQAAQGGAPISSADLACFVLAEAQRSVNHSGAQHAPPWFFGETLQLLTPQSQGATCGRCGETVDDALATFCPACGQSLFGVERLDGGRYRLLRALGEGGMGKVFLAEDTRLKAQRAIKLLSIPTGLPQKEREDMRGRLLQEAQAAQRLSGLSHHVVQVFDLGHSSEHGEPFLVMEVLEGETLTDRLRRGPMGVDATVRLGREIAEALAVAHGEGMIHRDLKPENIMLIRRGDRADFVKLLDFGLVKMEEAEVKTATGHIMGTLQYMPPEQLKGELVDVRADIFSFAAILYECLSGQRAVPGRTQREIFAVLLGEGVKPLAEVSPKSPRVLADLIDRALTLEVEARPKGVSEFLAVFDAMMSPRSSALMTQALEQTALKPQTKKRAGLMTLLFAMGLSCGWLGAQTLSPTIISGPTVVMAADAAPPPDAALDAALTPDAALALPLTPPASLEVLPDLSEITRRVEGERVIYSGGAAEARFAAALVDTLLSTTPIEAADAEARERWGEMAPPVRAALAARFNPEGFKIKGDGLAGASPEVEISVAALKAARAAQGYTSRASRVATFWLKKNAPLIVAKTGRCRKLRPGDQLVTAGWSIRGYSDGHCAQADCARKMAQALQKAGGVGEKIRLHFKISRKVKEGEETRLDTIVCHL